MRFAAAAVAFSGLGTGLYYSKMATTVFSDAGTKPDSSSTSVSIETPTPVILPPLPKLESESCPEFSPSETTVIFVLGGPGVGKGTQCAKLVAEHDFVHLSAGDLLREERSRPGSPYSELIEHYIREGKIVPHEITISLLRDAMRAHLGRRRFLIDGFPRSVEQGIEFEMLVCPSRMVLFFECEEEDMLKRLLGRSKDSGRSDDNVESIKKRFRTFHASTIPVKEFYKDWGKLRTISCIGGVEEVYRRTQTAIQELTDI